MSGQVRRVISLQVLFVVLLAASLAGLFGSAPAVSAVAGGVIGIVSSLVYAVIAYRGRPLAPQMVMKAHFAAEMFKMIAVALLFVLAIVFLKNELSAPGLFGGYLATTAGYWAALMFKN